MHEARERVKGELFQKRLISLFHDCGKATTIAKGDFLIKEGQVEQHVHLVESGALRVFYLTEFEEMIIRFGYKGSFITSLSSFINGTPSEFYMDAIRRTTVRSISKETLFTLVDESLETMKAYTSMLESLITQQVEREIDLLIHSPSDRLQRVLQRSPNLFQEIPLKYIASYLRMSPETLSRIRNS